MRIGFQPHLPYLRKFDSWMRRGSIMTGGPMRLQTLTEHVTLSAGPFEPVLHPNTDFIGSYKVCLQLIGLYAYSAICSHGFERGESGCKGHRSRIWFWPNHLRHSQGLPWSDLYCMRSQQPLRRPKDGECINTFDFYCHLCDTAGTQTKIKSKRDVTVSPCKVSTVGFSVHSH